MNVRILATCRNPELLPFTTMVFDSIRTGFPSAQITVFGNNLDGDIKEAVDAKCFESGCRFLNLPGTIHHDWILSLLDNATEPFWICDTDVVFHSNFERFEFNEALCGWRVPEWLDDFSGCITRSRLHTSLLRFDPAKVQQKTSDYDGEIAETPFTPRVNLINPLVVPFKGNPYFYDTCSLLYHAIGGKAFTDEQKDSYTHFNFGTISDLVLPRLPENEANDLKAQRDFLLKNPAMLKGQWRNQEQFYSNHPA
jgi:hypothetical protein